MDKIHLKNKAKLLKTQKLFIKLLIGVIIAFLLGTLYITILSKTNKQLINDTINNFFKEINNKNLNYYKVFFNSFMSYTLSGLVIWLLGISIVGIPFIILFLLFKSFVVGFSFSSLIYFYIFKGLVAAFIYTIPLVISLIALIILSFFAIRFSKRLIRVLFYRQDTALKNYTKRYLKILLILEIVLIICAVIETFIMPEILKLISLV